LCILFSNPTKSSLQWEKNVKAPASREKSKAISSQFSKIIKIFSFYLHQLQKFLSAELIIGIIRSRWSLINPKAPRTERRHAKQNIKHINLYVSEPV